MPGAGYASPPVDSVVLSHASDALLALSSGRRLAILNTLVELNARSGPVPMSDLARQAGLDLKTLSKEVVRLTGAGLVWRENHLLTARLSPLAELAGSVAELTALCQAVSPSSALRRYLSHGRIDTLPKRPEDLEAIAEVLAGLLPDDRSVTEAEVNEILSHAGDDVARLRRLLVDLGLVERYGSSEYRRLPVRTEAAAP